MKKVAFKKEKTLDETSYLESITDKIGEVAAHYGFTIVKPPKGALQYAPLLKQFKDFDYYEDAAEKIALTEWYAREKMDNGPQPVSVHYKKSPNAVSKKKPMHEAYCFEIMGSSRSTSEALLLKCLLAILDDLGERDIYVDVNSMGDRESLLKFERELAGFLRKHSADLPAKVRELCKKNHYYLLSDNTVESVPQPIGSLSEQARAHFKEVLEALELFGVMYKIRPSLLSNKLFASHTAFEIRKLSDGTSPSEKDELLAYGYRYNHLAKKMGGKREVPSVGATLFVKKSPVLSKKIAVKHIKKPAFYLVQLGGLAKLKALNVVELLRKHKIPVYHSVTKDKIVGQLSGAEYMKASHVLIIGVKEALEDTVVVRDVLTREQETVPVKDLPEFLKNLDKKK